MVGSRVEGSWVEEKSRSDMVNMEEGILKSTTVGFRKVKTVYYNIIFDI